MLFYIEDRKRNTGSGVRKEVRAMLKVLVACGCGMGSSQLLKKNCSIVLKKLGVEHRICQTSMDEARVTARNYDLILVGENFVNHLKVKEGTIVIGLKNLMNTKELETKLRESGILR